MKFLFKPTTRFGKWSVRLLAAFIGLYAVSVILAGLAMHKDGSVVSINPAFSPFLAVTGITALISGLAAFVTGLVSIIKEKEHSILVSVAVFIGALALIFLLGNMLISH